MLGISVYFVFDCSSSPVWASLVAQLVKNPPAKWNTWVLPLGWKDPSEKRMATHSSILAWRIPSPWDHKESDTTELLSLSPSFFPGLGENWRNKALR